MENIRCRFRYVNRNSLSIGLVFLGIFGICTVAFLAPATAIIQDVVQPGLRAFGFNVFFVNLIGAFSTPAIVGIISDKLFFLARNIYIFDKKRINFLLMNK